MPKRLFAAISALIIITALSGCGKMHSSVAEEAEKIKEVYKNAAEIAIEADIKTTDEKVREYRLSYEIGSDGKDKMVVLSPEEIAGVSAVISDGGAEIKYEDTILVTEMPGIPGFTPVDALCALIDDISDQIMEDKSFDAIDGQRCIAVSYEGEYLGSSTLKKAYFDEKTKKLIYGEWFIDDRKIMECAVESCVIK